MLSKEAIKEFKEIWKAEYKQRLSDKEAIGRAIRLISFFKVIYKPIPIGGKYGIKKA